VSRARVATERLFLALTCLYPGEFRRHFGDQLALVLRDTVAATAALPRLWWRLTRDFVLTASRAWLTAAAGLFRRERPMTDSTSASSGGGWGADVRYGLRGLRRSPGFSAAAALTLALGLGANMALFALVHTLILSPLPYREPEALTVLRGQQQRSDWGQIAFADFQDLAGHTDVLSQAAIVFLDQGTLLGDGPVARVPIRYVTPELFPMLGTEPVVGRTLLPEEGSQAGYHVALLAYGLWHSRFGGDPGVVGQTITVDGESFSVVGVLPPTVDLGFPEDGAALWMPWPADLPRFVENRTFFGFWGLARLAPGVTIEKANSALATIGRQLEAAYPATNANRTFAVFSLDETLRGDLRPALWLLLGVVGFILLIAGANTANLMLTRLVSRERELAVRTALGAGRLRIMRQLVIESLLIAGIGGGLGLGLAAGALALLRAAGWDPRFTHVTLDPQVLLFGAALTLVTGVLFGAAPAVIMTRRDPVRALRTGRTGGGKATLRLRGALVIGQVGLALMLLIGTGLLLVSLRRVLHVDAGFDRSGFLTMRLSAPNDRYPDAPSTIAFYRNLLDRVSHLPGVGAAGVSSTLPLEGRYSSSWFTIQGRALPPGEVPPSTGYQQVFPGWFRLLGVPIVAGRDFTEADVDERRHLTIINQTAADAFFPGENPVGKMIKLGPPDDSEPWHEIIGVVADVRTRGLLEESRPESYDVVGAHWGRTRALAVKTSGDPSALAPAVLAAVHDLDPEVPAYNVGTLEELVRQTVADRERLLQLVAGFSLLALLLAGVGIYGVMAYSVSQRHRELGIRMALGGTPADVLTLVLSQGGRLVAVGVVLGLAGAALLSRFIASQLFGVSPVDPTTYALVALALGAFGIVACLVPAHRAGRVDPVTVMREE